MTINEAWTLAPRELMHLRPKSIKNYTTIFNVHIKKHLGEQKISSLTKEELRSLVIDMPTGHEQKQHTKVVLAHCFTIAGIEMPSLGLKIRKTRTTILPLTKNEITRVLEASQGWFKNYLAVAIYTGMRAGEILALTKADIDLDKGYIHVDKTCTDGKIGETKTVSSIRDIPIFAPLLPYIHAQLAQGEHWLFENKKGEHFYGSTTAGVRWHKLIAELGIPKRRMYETRHTFASQMLATGKYPAIWIARWLGHCNLQMLFKVYGKYIPAEWENINRELDF